MPYKLCSRGHENGPRSKKCSTCGEVFVSAIVTKIAADEVPEENEPEAYKNWEDLKKGDHIRALKGHGPYTLIKKDDGSQEKIGMGYYGKFKVLEVMEDGILACGNKREGELSTCFLYMGQDYLSDTGLYKEAHKIIKLKEKRPK